ncbi:beta-ketoacyl-ACP synthase 3 [uncultured Jatrophihabitans sp.]|uniref:beta-ketoacyl-ACP synthase 3 n=1 Tax=uncultured Jatrophihabitans sp. TaxID=1610747 RepID=UPI0035CA0B8D
MLNTVAREGGTRVLGFGAAQPHASTSADALGAPFGKAGSWIESRTGIRSVRRVSGPGELDELVCRSAADALLAAGITEAQIDLVVTASCSAANGPGDGGTLAAGVAAVAPRMHLNSACSGFCYALTVADGAIRTGAARHVLVVAAEQMSSLIDPADLGTSILFGDGAGAAVVGPSGDGSTGIGPAVWGSDGSQSHLIDCGAVVGGKLTMVGSQVFRWAVEQMPAVALDACRRAGVGIEDIDVFVPHQANKRIVDGIAAKLGLDRAVIADSVTVSGNTSAASIPIAVVDLARRGVTCAGQLALLVGFGAGLSFAAQVIRLP